MLKLKISQFCGLSTNAKWSSWLLVHAPDLYNDLTRTLSKGGCNNKISKMKEIKDILYKRNMGGLFEELMQTTFPSIVDGSTDRGVTHESISNDSVFKSYNEEILTFPQKKILSSSSNDELNKMLSEFISDKAGVDYVIINNKAYIEYFDKKYADVVNKIPVDTREIYKYKLGHNIK